MENKTFYLFDALGRLLFVSENFRNIKKEAKLFYAVISNKNMMVLLANKYYISETNIFPTSEEEKSKEYKKLIENL